jgi:hypothetical protein
MFPFDQNNQQMYQNYAQAANTGDYSGIDPNQAYGHVQQFMQNAPPEMQQQTYQQYFQQMPMDQRQQFTQQMPPQYQQQMDPNNPQMRECVLDVGRRRHHTSARHQGHWLPVDTGLFAPLNHVQGPAACGYAGIAVRPPTSSTHSRR